MKHLLAAILFFPLTCLAQISVQPIPSTPTTREMMRENSVSGLRNFLGVGPGTNCIVDTLAALVTIPSPIEGGIAVCSDARRGGIFFMTNTIVETNSITRFKMSTPYWSVHRVYEGPVNVKWASPDKYISGAEVNEALKVGAGGDIFFPSDATCTYLIDEVLRPESNSRLLGYGATLRNGATNLANFVMLIITNKHDILMEGLTFDAGLGSHYRNGNIDIIGSTNVKALRITSRYGGYLGNFAILSNGPPSLNCGAEQSFFYDQRYGGSGQSLAGYSVAQDAQKCYSRFNTFDFPTLGNNTNIFGWVPLGSGHPNAPILTVSFDRAPDFESIGDRFLNTSKYAGATAFSIEDNNQAPNCNGRVSNCFIDGYNLGFSFAYIDGSFEFQNVTVQNCKTYGLRLNQTEAADQHRVKLLRISNSAFRNNYANPLFGQDANEHWRNQGGQISYVANPPYRLLIENSEFTTSSTNSDFTHILYGAGEFISKGNTFRNGAYGIRAMDPDTLSTDPNSYYEANPSNRRVFISEDRFDGVTNSIYGLPNTKGAEVLEDVPGFEMTSRFAKTISTNSLTTLFTIKTVQHRQSVTGLGTAGSFTCEIDGHISNASSDVTTYGQVGARSFHAEFTYAVNYDFGGTNLPTAALSVVTGHVTPMAQSIGRGFRNIVITPSCPNYYETPVKIAFDGVGDVTSGNVSGIVRIKHSGFYRPPLIVK
jgi:hypothetical protein